MKPRVLALSAAVALVFLMILVASNPGTPQPVPAPAKTVVDPQPVAEKVPEPPGPPPTPPVPVPSPEQQKTRVSASRDLADPLVPSAIPDVSPPPSAPSDAETAADLDKITLMFRDYRTIAGENPVGTNAEIMKAIMGGNPKGAMLGPPEGQSLNDKDELIDRWGTPYFFHQLSKDLMEIHSAGPDRIMGTRDDVVAK